MERTHFRLAKQSDMKRLRCGPESCAPPDCCDRLIQASQSERLIGPERVVPVVSVAFPGPLFGTCEPPPDPPEFSCARAPVARPMAAINATIPRALMAASPRLSKSDDNERERSSFRRAHHGPA